MTDLQRASAAKLVDLVVYFVENEILVVLQAEPPRGIDNVSFRQLIHHLNLLEIYHDAAACSAGDVSHLR
jgi:hypothetical protein